MPTNKQKINQLKNLLSICDKSYISLKETGKNPVKYLFHDKVLLLLGQLNNIELTDAQKTTVMKRANDLLEQLQLTSTTKKHWDQQRKIDDFITHFNNVYTDDVAFSHGNKDLTALEGILHRIKKDIPIQALTTDNDTTVFITPSWQAPEPITPSIQDAKEQQNQEFTEPTAEFTEDEPELPEIIKSKEQETLKASLKHLEGLTQQKELETEASTKSSIAQKLIVVVPKKIKSTSPTVHQQVTTKLGYRSPG